MDYNPPSVDYSASGSYEMNGPGGVARGSYEMSG